MDRKLELDVARHYGVEGLLDRILKAVSAAGLDPDRLQPADLAAVDEFHIGGRAATQHAVGKLSLRPEDHVLDIGCGLGGTARFIAASAGCHVTGIDLTPEYIDVARALAERTRLTDSVDFVTGSALAMPFADTSFDAAITIHVAMNIADRAGLYRQISRVLKPGALFCLYDVMQGTNTDIDFPVPWAETSETSHLETPQHMHQLLADSGFQVIEAEDRTAFGIDFFRQRNAAAAAGPPALGIHLLMRANAPVKFRNMQLNLEKGSIAPVVMLARRR